MSPEHSFVWLQIADTTCTQHNLAEAMAVSDLVGRCLLAGLSTEDIAVVTPFRRQAMRIRSILSSILPSGVSCPIVDTVERVQGLTVEVILVSLCASDMDYVTSEAGFLLSPNRMNVAVSRARTKAIVLASPVILNLVPADYAALQARDLCRDFLKAAFIVTT